MYQLSREKSTSWTLLAQRITRSGISNPSAVQKCSYNLLIQLTGNDPSRMAESSAINKSLSVLGQVVHALNTGAVGFLMVYGLPKNSYIHAFHSQGYLTGILQDALGGSSVGLLICNLAPSNKFRQDTLNTLKCVVLFPPNIGPRPASSLLLISFSPASPFVQRTLKINLLSTSVVCHTALNLPRIFFTEAMQIIAPCRNPISQPLQFNHRH